MDAVEVYPPEDEIEFDEAWEVLFNNNYTQEEISEMSEEEIVETALEIIAEDNADAEYQHWIDSR